VTSPPPEGVTRATRDEREPASSVALVRSQTGHERSDDDLLPDGRDLRPDAPSYAEPQADWELYDGLSHGEFCYVLTARQMGKPSLMARTADHLREQGTTVLSLDLSAIDQNLSLEQWYDGLLRLIA
jgi:hypothetical protein